MIGAGMRVADLYSSLLAYESERIVMLPPEVVTEVPDPLDELLLARASTMEYESEFFEADATFSMGMSVVTHAQPSVRSLFDHMRREINGDI